MCPGIYLLFPIYFYKKEVSLLAKSLVSGIILSIFHREVWKSLVASTFPANLLQHTGMVQTCPNSKFQQLLKEARTIAPPAPSPSVKTTQPPAKKMKIENDRESASDTQSSIWLRVADWFMTLQDKESIYENKLLSDRHINVSQKLLRKQFPEAEVSSVHFINIRSHLHVSNQVCRLFMIKEEAIGLLPPL